MTKGYDIVIRAHNRLIKQTNMAFGTKGEAGYVLGQAKKYAKKDRRLKQLQAKIGLKKI